MEKLSVIIATINDSIATNLTIAQIIFQLEHDKIDYEIVIVDNGSNEEEKKNLQALLNYHKDFPISYYDYPDIRGTIPPHSYGVTKAKGKYITMPDPHMIFSNHYFKIMIKTLKELKEKGVEVVFGPFNIAHIAKGNWGYIYGSPLILPNPFGKTSSIGSRCQFGDPICPILANTIASMVCEREWLLKIGNMFPDAFKAAGGHTAESLMIGITTWMFGKKCYAQPKAVAEHPVYRWSYGEGRNANMHLSMATGAYILGGEKYLQDMPKQYGHDLSTLLKEIPPVAGEARKYVEANAKLTLDYFVENWETIKNG